MPTRILLLDTKNEIHTIILGGNWLVVHQKKKEICKKKVYIVYID